MNNKGFTVVELIITFVIVMVISLGLFSTVDSYRERQQKELYKKELESYKNEILKIIQDDVTRKGLNQLNKIDIFSYVIGAEKVCENYDQGLELVFKDSNKKVLCFGNDVAGVATLLYGDKKFVAPSKFVNFEQDIIDSENAEANSFVYYSEEGTADDGNIEYKSSMLSKKVYSVNIKISHQELVEKTYLNIVIPTITSTISGSGECSVKLSGRKLNLDVEKYNKCGSEILSTLGSKIEELTISGSSEPIKNIAFLNTVGKIVIDGSVKEISDNAFESVEGLKTIDLTKVTSTDIIGKRLFWNTHIETLIINNSNTDIFGDAFSDVGNIDNLILKKNGDGVAHALPIALKGKVKKLSFEEGITSIESRAYFAFGLMTLKLPNSLKEIGNFGFFGNKLETLDFRGLTYDVSIGESAFENNLIDTIFGTEKLSYIGDYAFYNNVIGKSSTNEVITLNAKYIGISSFEKNQISGLAFGNDVKIINNFAFRDCGNLEGTSFNFPCNLERIGLDAFSLVSDSDSLNKPVAYYDSKKIFSEVFDYRIYNSTSYLSIRGKSNLCS